MSSISIQQSFPQAVSTPSKPRGNLVFNPLKSPQFQSVADRPFTPPLIPSTSFKDKDLKYSLLEKKGILGEDVKVNLMYDPILQCYFDPHTQIYFDIN